MGTEHGLTPRSADGAVSREQPARGGGRWYSAIMSYHRLKMDEVNKIIADLWNETYDGGGALCGGARSPRAPQNLPPPRATNPSTTFSDPAQRPWGDKSLQGPLLTANTGAGRGERMARRTWSPRH